MSTLGRAAVRFAARTLPAGIRARYREEWLGDLQSARAEGVHPASVAIGALLFSVTLNRDAPQLSGIPLTAMAVRHARSSIALLAVAAVLLFGTWFNGQISYTTGTTTIGSIVGASVVPWRSLAVVAALVGVVYLWRAALLASMLARVTAVLGTIGVVCVGAATALPMLGAALVPLGCAGLVGAAVCGLIVWSSAPQPAPPSRAALTPPTPSSRIRGRVVVFLGVGGGIMLASGLLFSGFAITSFALLAIGAAITVSVLVTRQRLHAPRTTQHQPWATVVLASLALFALVTVGTLDLLLWTPAAMAPAYTIDEIYAALSPQDRVLGIASALVWTIVWGLVAVSYVVVGIISARRPRVDTRRNLVLIAAAIVAVAIFLQWFAGFSLGMNISDTLPPFVGTRADFGALLGLVGQLCLCAVIFGWIAPRRREVAVGQPA